MNKLILLFFLTLTLPVCAQQTSRTIENFDQDWSFNLGDVDHAQNAGFDDSKWRRLDLPHDWSIEGRFSKENPATPEGGALPGGIGWHRKSFKGPPTL